MDDIRCPGNFSFLSVGIVLHIPPNIFSLVALKVLGFIFLYATQKPREESRFSLCIPNSLLSLSLYLHHKSSVLMNGLRISL